MKKPTVASLESGSVGKKKNDRWRFFLRSTAPAVPRVERRELHPRQRIHMHMHIHIEVCAARRLRLAV
jgi:hypothetical protein